MVFSRGMRASRITNGAQQLIEAVFGDEPSARPRGWVEPTTAWPPTSLSATSAQEADQPHAHVAVELVEFGRGIASSEVAAPAAEHRIQHSDDFPNVFHPCPASGVGEIMNLGADRLHGPLRRPPEQIALSLESGLYYPQMTAQKVEAFLADSQFHQPGLGRM